MNSVLTPVWKTAEKKWKNKLHNICSYLAMFPPSLPNYFIDQFTVEGDYVLDPFCGRGTALLEASLLKRIPIGNDLNPLAYTLSFSKVNIPKYEKIKKRIKQLQSKYKPEDISEEPDDIKMLFDEELTLPQLCYLKKNLIKNKPIDMFILSMLLGILHGQHRKDGSSNSLSISMPNTFSMSPNYIREYIKKNNLIKLKQDVFECLYKRLEDIYPFDSEFTKGYVFQDNALNLSNKKYKKFYHKIKLIVTSPPYLKVINYGKYNWIRLWLLDEKSEDVDSELRINSAYRKVDKIKLSDDMKLEQYLEFMKQLICGWEKLITEDGEVAIVIGDVDNHKGVDLNLAQAVWNFVRPYTNFKKLAIIKDSIDGNSKVTKIWGRERKGNATKTDRILLLSKDINALKKANHTKKVKNYYANLYGGKNV